jgi:hypothetical protein
VSKKNWTVAELAAEANVSGSWVRQLLVNGDLKGHKHGPLWAIPDEEAQHYLTYLKTRKGGRRGPRPKRRNVKS